MLAGWQRDADPVVRRLQRLEPERAALRVWQSVIERLADTSLDFGRLAAAGPSTQVALFVFPQDVVPTVPADLLVRALDVDGEPCLLVLGTGDAIGAAAQQAAAQRGRKIEVPGWLAPTRDASLALIAARHTPCEREIDALRSTLATLEAKHALGPALTDIVRAAWCFRNAGPIEGGGILARINGWTGDPARVAADLDRSGARALVHFPAAPAHAQPPLVLRNPRWVQPFELFSRLLGMPGRFGADPSALLAVVVPLLFGYMFGDVGQGAVLLVAGLALQARMPVLRLLVPGGIAAIAFGFVFGTVFSLHGIVPPLWIDPLVAPLPVLLVPLAGGAALLTLGLALGGLEAWWSHEFARWLRREAGLAAVYVGIMAGFLHPGAYLLAAAGAAWYVLGHASIERRVGAAPLAVLALAEKTIQILVNTLSFVRVGAFALAHAGLSAAVVALAEGTGNRVGYVLALVAGNLLVIALEGLVVAIQTTRLVLFEFFIRFFAATGRAFRPLAPPSPPAEETLHEART